MGGIKIGRVLVGGLLAGLIINISESILNTAVEGAELERVLGSMNLPPIDPNMIVGFVVLGFVLGIMTVWLYAAIRPRLGAGPRTAGIAGVMVWFFAYLYPNAGMAIMHMFPRRMLAVATIWGLCEMIISAIAGARLYKE